MLNIKIYSFSYKKSGIPADKTPNGGGFVFDCRFIYNPGREEKFMQMNGKDKEVIEFLENDTVMNRFLSNVYSITDDAVDNYLSRNFSDLMISFGCTGGQHRSVFSAEKLKQHLQNKFKDKVKITINHREFPELNN